MLVFWFSRIFPPSPDPKIALCSRALWVLVELSQSLEVVASPWKYPKRSSHSFTESFQCWCLSSFAPFPPSSYKDLFFFVKLRDTFLVQGWSHRAADGNHVEMRHRCTLVFFRIKTFFRGLICIFVVFYFMKRLWKSRIFTP